jgi:alginate O-acetyltransferase complex protein AlgI
MQFNSYSYLILLALSVAVFWAIPVGWRRVYVGLLGAAFYASWSWVYLPLPFLLSAAAGLCARRMVADPGRARRWLWTGIGATLTVLAFFKYRQFLIDNLNTALQLFGAHPVETTLAIALPLGISFYSFEAISFLIDTGQGRVKRVTFTDLSLFVTFWPHLIAGPIVRVRELIPQLAFKKPFEMAFLTRGLDRLIWGLVQKNLIANNLGAFVDEGFLPNAAQINSAVDNWCLAFAFGLQIYFDFASYTNMAIGAAQLVGVGLPENFRFPYHAQSPPDFWSRWHMTLSRWIRDYLFFPINAKFKGAPLPLYASLIGIMAVVGLWHGAAWGFVVWGVMHGVYLVIFRMWENLVATRYPGLAQSGIAGAGWRIFTLLSVMAAWIPFRCGSVSQAFTMLKSMALLDFKLRVSYPVNLYLVTSMVLAFTMVEPLVAGWLEKSETRWLHTPVLRRLNLYLLRPLLYAVGLLLFLAFDDQDTQFIYFQF